MTIKLMLAAGIAMSLSACGAAVPGNGGVNARVSNAGLRPATNDQRGAAGAQRAPANLQPGEIIGRDRAALIASFGQPRLDAAEGAATRLQFSSAACVLDAYLFPPRAGAAAVVTHVDARTPEGADTDRSACISAMRRR